jgi:hypothetical protein
MRARVFFAAGAIALLSSAAIAQVPVADAPRGTTEKGIADCTAKARQYKSQTLSPTQGVKGSVATPGDGGTGSNAGSASVSGVNAPASRTVANVDLSNLTSASSVSSGAATAGGVSVGAVNQATSSLSATGGAMSQNVNALNGLGASIGSVNTAQGGWDQNSASRMGAASVWGQAIQLGTLILQLRNQALMQRTMASSQTAVVMSYDAAAARLAAAPANGAVNGSVAANQGGNYAANALALAQFQVAAQAHGTPVLALWQGAAK